MLVAGNCFLSTLEIGQKVTRRAYYKKTAAPQATTTRMGERDGIHVGQNYERQGTVRVTTSVLQKSPVNQNDGKYPPLPTPKSGVLRYTQH